MSFRVSPILLVVGLTAANAAAGPGDDHWAWSPPKRPPVPTVRGPQPTSPIDAFVRAKLDAAGLSLATPATREHLIRRATFDLTGLPPTPAEIDAFLADHSPSAWERVVDRLLASPHYGERWGRHWLDLARYADTNGFEHDEVRPDAWRYRDYVIRSFNADKPYDRFVVEQLAGDEANPDDPDAAVATGFNLLGPDMTDSADPAQRRLNTLNDMTDTTGLVFLGMTLACARCHDHKFEPIPQADYYRLQAFFAPAEFRANVIVANETERRRHEMARQEYDRLTEPVQSAITALDGPLRKRIFEAKLGRLTKEEQLAHRTPFERRDGGQLELIELTAKKVAVTDAEVEKLMPAADVAKLKELRKQLRAFDRQKPPALPVAMGMVDRFGPPPKTFLLERGELSNKSDEVTPGFPTILSPGGVAEPASFPEVAAGRRLTLAKWVAGPNNPMTARVMVNRVWQHHFGRGIVPTPSDFGIRGEEPTHPELLDWLAVEFVEHGWSLKRLHKLILTSETYRQSAVPMSDAATKDPENRMFSRMNRIRLDAEAVRDALLAVSGRLNPTMGGPGVRPPVAAEAVKGAKGGWAVSPDPRDHVRRSVYLFARRNLRHPFLEAFDLPDSNLSCPKRERSTTAPQALALLNAVEATTAAEALGERLSKEPEAAHIDRAYRITLGRHPTSTERTRAAAFLRESPLSELCRALLNTNEFVYLD